MIKVILRYTNLQTYSSCSLLKFSKCHLESSSSCQKSWGNPELHSSSYIWYSINWLIHFPVSGIFPYFTTFPTSWDFSPSHFIFSLDICNCFFTAAQLLHLPPYFQARNQSNVVKNNPEHAFPQLKFFQLLPISQSKSQNLYMALSASTSSNSSSYSITNYPQTCWLKTSSIYYYSSQLCWLAGYELVQAIHLQIGWFSSRPTLTGSILVLGSSSHANGKHVRRQIEIFL